MGKNFEKDNITNRTHYINKLLCLLGRCRAANACTIHVRLTINVYAHISAAAGLTHVIHYNVGYTRVTCVCLTSVETIQFV